MGGDPVTIRVLDWGGEKEIEALQSEGMVPEVADANPALGLRGIRLLLRQPELLETQLAAILRAALAGPVRVLLPMVTTVAEVRAAREIYERVARRLRRRGERLPEPLPPLGIMIETPGAALSADALALEADFFAIGTNDLADVHAGRRSRRDRGRRRSTIRCTRRCCGWCSSPPRRRCACACRSRCAARWPANPRLTPLLLGLGLRSFSMNASAVPRVKQAVRAAKIDDCVRFARRVMEQSDPARIQELVLGTAPS